MRIWYKESGQKPERQSIRGHSPRGIHSLDSGQDKGHKASAFRPADFRGPFKSPACFINSLFMCVRCLGWSMAEASHGLVMFSLVITQSRRIQTSPKVVFPGCRAEPSSRSALLAALQAAHEGRISVIAKTHGTGLRQRME